MTEVGFPFRVDRRGRTAGADEVEHLRDLVEQVLFTSPGERVNRPTFGSGLLGLVFAPLDDAAAAAVELAVQGALQQWLGDLIQVDSVDVEADDATLRVTVAYQNRRTQTRDVVELTRAV